MMAMINDGCPVCYSKKKEHLEATGGEWVGLVMTGYGGVRPCVCLNCGTIYVSRDDLKQVDKWRKRDGN
jgi:hypothetical protein